MAELVIFSLVRKVFLRLLISSLIIKCKNKRESMRERSRNRDSKRKFFHVAFTCRRKDWFLVEVVPDAIVASLEYITRLSTTEFFAFNKRRNLRLSRARL